MNISVTYALVQKLAELGVGLAEPAPVSYTVGNVGKLFGSVIIEVLEYRLLDYLAVECGYAVNLVAAVYRKVCHLNFVVFEYGHARYLVPLSGIFLPEVFAHAPVYLLNYRVDAGHLPADEVLRPRFERLCKHGVVGVCAGRGGHRPRVFPAEVVFIYEHAHELGYGHCGVRIV